MFKLLKSLLFAALILPVPALAHDANADLKGVGVKVMVLGTYHFANPGQDVVNMEADDVLSDQRQQELAALADALIAFRPTKVVVENEISPPDFIDPAYAQFTLADLQSQRNETVQIAYRVANLAGHGSVYGFDEQPGEGEPDYFPFGKVTKFAEANGQADLITAIFAEVRTVVAQMEKNQATMTIPELLRQQNDDAKIGKLHNFAYNGLLAVGDGDAQPGAELNALWFMRNAKMFAKLGLIAEPGDRVLVVVGGGHKFWLDHLLETTPGYVKVSPMQYLAMAAAQLESRD